jgi:N-hydroxyarylamine O-acetyltransferase
MWSLTVTRIESVPVMSQTALTPDLDAYFRRIGYTGHATVDLNTLTALVRHHTRTIAFENLNPVLRWPVQLDLESLQHKLVRDGRGGYCFEQNLLMAHVLQALGFEVTKLAARVRWNVPDGIITARGHMLMRVDLDEQPYIVDVGFGGLTLTGVLRIEPDLEQHTPHEPFRLTAAGNGTFLMQAKIHNQWQSLYSFDLQEQYLPDYQVTSWYLSNHPDSHFIKDLIVARPDRDRRFALHNNELAIHYLNGHSKRRRLTTVIELREVLTENFRITLPDGPDLDTTLQRFIVG